MDNMDVGNQGNMLPQSNSTLKVSGILMIILGAIALIFSIIGLVGIVAAAQYLGGDFADLGVGNYGLIITSGVLAVVGAAAMISAGIIGVLYAAKPQKATVCVSFAVLVISVTVVNNIMNVVNGAKFSIAGLALGLILPIVYLSGALKNKKIAKMQ